MAKTITVVASPSLDDARVWLATKIEDVKGETIVHDTHKVYVNSNGTLACNCTAGTFNKACCHKTKVASELVRLSMQESRRIAANKPVEQITVTEGNTTFTTSREAMELWS